MTNSELAKKMPISKTHLYLMFISSKLTAKILYKILFSMIDNIYITNAEIEICYI